MQPLTAIPTIMGSNIDRSTFVVVLTVVFCCSILRTSKMFVALVISIDAFSSAYAPQGWIQAANPSSLQIPVSYRFQSFSNDVLLLLLWCLTYCKKNNSCLKKKKQSHTHTHTHTHARTHAQKIDELQRTTVARKRHLYRAQKPILTRRSCLSLAFQCDTKHATLSYILEYEEQGRG